MSDLTVSGWNEVFEEWEDTREASRSDVLEWLGWEKCQSCKGIGRFNLDDYQGNGTACPSCISGLVPSAHQVEAVKNAIARTFIEEMGWGESKPWEALEVYAMAETQARAALIAAMKAVSDD